MSKKDTLSKVIGVQRSAGNYQGYDYDNLVLYVAVPCTSEVDGESAGIRQTDRVKIPWADVDRPLKEYIGLKCEVYYDRYGKPCDIEFE